MMLNNISLKRYGESFKRDIWCFDFGLYFPTDKYRKGNVPPGVLLFLFLTKFLSYPTVGINVS